MLMMLRYSAGLSEEADAIEAVILFACFRSPETYCRAWVSNYDKLQHETMVHDILECFLIPI